MESFSTDRLLRAVEGFILIDEMEKAERMLSSLGIEMARERDTYYSDREYAAALLGVSPHVLDGFLDGTAGEH